MDDLFNKIENEVKELTQAVIDKSPEFYIDLPKTDAVDYTAGDLSDYVARTSNAFIRAARFAGMAGAMHKRAAGRYNQKFKTSRTGNNADARDKSAFEATKEEHKALMQAESILELARSLESACRLASESARKIFDKVQAVEMGQRRLDTGTSTDDRQRSKIEYSY